MAQVTGITIRTTDIVDGKPNYEVNATVAFGQSELALRGAGDDLPIQTIVTNLTTRLVQLAIEQVQASLSS